MKSELPLQSVDLNSFRYCGIMVPTGDRYLFEEFFV